MSWMDDIEKAASTIMVVWGLLALVLGPVAFFRIRKFFPERREAISPEQLAAALEKFDFGLREAVNVSVGRVQTSFEVQHSQLRSDLSELKENMIEAHRKAAAAHEEAREANHKAELNQKDVQTLEKVMTERMDHMVSLLKAAGGK